MFFRVAANMSPSIKERDEFSTHSRMGISSSRAVALNLQDDLLDTADSDASKLAHESKFPARTIRLSRTYNRCLCIFTAQSRFIALSRAMRQLKYVKGFHSGAEPLAAARERSLKIAPDGLECVAPAHFGLTLHACASGHLPCLELTSSAYMRLCACGLTTQLAIHLCGALRGFQHLDCSVDCRHILRRVYNCSITEVFIVPSVVMRQCLQRCALL
jgi:hypothetical protein